MLAFNLYLCGISAHFQVHICFSPYESGHWDEFYIFMYVNVKKQIIVLKYVVICVLSFSL